MAWARRPYNTICNECDYKWHRRTLKVNDRRKCPNCGSLDVRAIKHRTKR